MDWSCSTQEKLVSVFACSITFWPFIKADPAEGTLLASLPDSAHPDLPFWHVAAIKLAALRLPTNFNQSHTQFHQVLYRSNLHLTPTLINTIGKDYVINLTSNVFLFIAEDICTLCLYLIIFQHLRSWLPDLRETKSTIPLYCNSTEISLIYQNSHKGASLTWHETKRNTRNFSLNSKFITDLNDHKTICQWEVHCPASLLQDIWAFSDLWPLNLRWHYCISGMLIPFKWIADFLKIGATFLVMGFPNNFTINK